MTATITDLFCGAGGSSLGAEAAGGTLVMAANHWQMAIDVHQANFPDAGHDCADISQADPRRYNGQAAPVTKPMGTQPTRDRFALLDPDQVIDDCGFRMLEPFEVAAAMAFPVDYIPRDIAKKDQVKLAGNAVTPPVMQWIVGRIIQALEAR